MQVFHTVFEGRVFKKHLELKARGRSFWCFISELAAAQRGQSFLWAPVFLSVGIVTYFSLRTEPSYFIATCVFALPLIAWLFCKRYEPLRPLLLFLFFAGAGFAAAKIRTDIVHTPILKKEIQFAEVVGTISAVEHFADQGGQRIVIENPRIEKLPNSQTPRKLRIKMRGTQDLRVGQTVKILAGLNPPSPPLLPGGFDYQRYMYFKGIGAIGFSYGGAEILVSPEKKALSGWLQNLRSDIARHASEAFGRSGGVAAALLVGHKTGIAEKDQEAMRHAGLAHMLAISGLHIGLFFGFVFFVSRLVFAGIPVLALNYPIKKYAAVIAMVATVLYMLLAGATIPTQRAVLMTGAVFVAILLDRTPLSMRLVAFAAIVVLLVSPESLLSASFQMSFAAVAGLVAFYNVIRPYWAEIHRQHGLLRRTGLYVLGVCLTSIVATLATAPFALFHFQQLALYSLLSNLLAMPILAFIVMPFAVVYFLLLPFGFENLVLGVMSRGIGWILDIAHFTAGLDYAVLHTVLWPTWLFVLLVLSFIILVIGQGALRWVSPLLLAMFLFGANSIRQPEILVAPRSQLVALRQSEGLLSFSSLKKDRFVRGQWARAYGQEGQKPLKWPKEGVQGDLICGEQGCRLERFGNRVSILRDLKIFNTECEWADILIASDPLPECNKAYTIDRFDYKKGSYALGFQPGLVSIETSFGQRGRRPWATPQ